jgi:hyperosmotically inducible protein
MKTKTSSLAALLAAAVLLATGGAVRAADSDDRIESSAKNSHVFKTYLKDDSVKVDSKNGIVTLTGKVADSSHKVLAEDTVAGLPGVKKVNNQIEVTGKAAADRSDAWISTKVKSNLLFHRNVSASKTEVNVVDGVVTLTGSAETQAQKELTAEYARDVDGVRDVKNLITVVPKANTDAAPRDNDRVERKGDDGRTIGEKIDDASITAQVKASLATHRSTSAIKTKVETRDGVVYLSGMARSQAEKTLVTKLVTDINGVKSVVNGMTVDPALTQK